MLDIRHTFRSHERLKSRKLIAQLFDKGQSMSQLYPLQLFYLLHADTSLPSHQVLFSVPKKKVKKASQRNNIRRRMKEAYRLHKHELPALQPHSPRFLLGYVYVGPPKPVSYAMLCSKTVASLRRLVAIYKQHGAQAAECNNHNYLHIASAQPKPIDL